MTVTIADGNRILEIPKDEISNQVREAINGGGDGFITFCGELRQVSEVHCINGCYQIELIEQ